MSDFFESPILNSPYEEPSRYWALDEDGRPTGTIVNGRRDSSYVTPIARASRDAGMDVPKQDEFDLSIKSVKDDGQLYQYDIINTVRKEVSKWRHSPEKDWKVTPETAKLLKHWRHHKFSDRRPFFCQVEAAEIYIWLTE